MASKFTHMVVLPLSFCLWKKINNKKVPVIQKVHLQLLIAKLLITILYSIWVNGFHNQNN